MTAATLANTSSRDMTSHVCLPSSPGNSACEAKVDFTAREPKAVSTVSEMKVNSPTCTQNRAVPMIALSNEVPVQHMSTDGGAMLLCDSSTVNNEERKELVSSGEKDVVTKTKTCRRKKDMHQEMEEEEEKAEEKENSKKTVKKNKDDNGVRMENIESSIKHTANK